MDACECEEVDAFFKLAPKVAVSQAQVEVTGVGSSSLSLIILHLYVTCHMEEGFSICWLVNEMLV